MTTKEAQDVVAEFNRLARLILDSGWLRPSYAGWLTHIASSLTAKLAKGQLP